MDPLDFDGTEEEFKILLAKQIEDGKISEEVADAMFAAYSQKNSGEQSIVTTPEIAAPSIEQQQADFTAQAQAALEADNAARPWWDKQLRIGTPSMSGASDEELTALNNEAAQAELAERKRISELSFIDSLTDTGALSRIGRSALRGPGQAINAFTYGLPGLVLTGAEAVTGTELGAKGFIQELQERNAVNNKLAGVSNSITAQESIAESLTGAVVPGGILAKATGVTADFVADQTVRELTDDKGEKYETVFDRLGITDNNAAPTLGTLGAIGVGLLAGSLTTSSIAKLSMQKLDPPKIVPLEDIDPTAPKKLSTVEKASDLTKTNIVDEQQALRDIIRRNGVPDIDDIDTRIEFDTHAAARTRVAEAVNTGELTTRDAVFKSSVPPRALYDGYNALAPKNRQAVARYINLKDMRDDLQIALGKGQATQQQIFDVDLQLQNIVKNFPEAEVISKSYNVVTQSLREFAEGSLFSDKYKVFLDKTRPNYVPLEITDIDPTAPFLQRLKQAQVGDGGRGDPEWFLQNRKIGSYDLERRADPMNMLMQSVEATLSARMKNDTKVAIVDGLLQSPIGQQTLRKASKNEAGKFSDRTIQLYRNGKKETYITSKLTAQLMQFDPYIAKYPALFVPKRIFEQSAVGPVSVTFAPVTAMRDAIGGLVSRPEGLLAAGPIDVAAAIPKQLWAKTQGSISDFFQQSIVKGETPLPTWLMTPQAQQRFADNIGASYAQTLYHQANNAGGFDASLMKNKIELGQGVLSEVKRSLDNVAADYTIPGAGFTARRINNMLNGFSNIFNLIQDAPRYAAIDKTVKAGVGVEEATGLARKLTGDVTKSGRVFNADGKRLDVDAVDQGVLNFANKGIGTVTEVLRESTPFLNPMIQGNRSMLQRIVEDPIGFNARAWLHIGLPSLAIFGWNEMLGQEYNDYAMQRRSARDVVMNTYIAVPGLPPEQGIEIPMMHELLTFSAPFTRGLYGLSRGEETEKTRGALSIVAENIFNNSLDIGFPVAGQVAANVSGISAPESLANPTEGIYKIREDDLGVLPQNLETLSRTLFAGIGDTAMHVANAVAGDPSFETLYSEMKDRTLKRVPIIKNVAGKKAANVQFSIPSAQAEERFDSLAKFRQYYNEFFEPKRKNADGLSKPASKRTFTNFKDVDNPLEAPDLPFLNPGPENLEKPENPIYEKFGHILVNDTFRGKEGMTALNDRYRTYSKYLKKLRSFNSGDREALRDWQAMLNNIVPEEEGTQKLKDLLSENNINLTKYDDRVKLMNLIEEHRSDIVRSQIDVFKRIEDKMTVLLHQEGILPEDQEFDITKHLDPQDANPFDIANPN